MTSPWLCIDGDVADELIELLRARCASPREAAVVLALWKLGRANDSNDEEAIEAISTAYRSMRDTDEQLQ